MKIQGLEFIGEVTIPAEKNFKLINQGIDPAKIKDFTYKKWVAPDGTEGSYSFFEGEILKKGRLHGCVVGF
jgi:hypothetical protein